MGRYSEDIESYENVNGNGRGLNLGLRITSGSAIRFLPMTVHAIRPHADSRAVSIEAGEHLDVQVLGDPVRLRQILYNPLSNGAKCTETGGYVKVELCRRRRICFVSLVRITGWELLPKERELARNFPSANNWWRCRVAESGERVS